jgi:hypothetical protein
MRCALCSHEFDAASQGCRPGCPLARGCGLLCCPRCGHSFPKETRLSAFVKRTLVKLERRR